MKTKHLYNAILLPLILVSLPSCNVKKENVEISIETLSKVYDATPAVVSPSITNDATPTISWYQNGNILESAPKNAGEYTVKIDVESTDKYKASSEEFTYTIEQKELTLSWSIDNCEFNFEPHEAKVKGTNVILGDTVNFVTKLYGDNIFKTIEGFYYEVTSIDNNNYKLPENTKSQVYNISDDPFDIAIEIQYDEACVDYNNYSHISNSVDIREGINCFKITLDTDCDNGFTFELLDSEYKVLENADVLKVYDSNKRYIRGISNDFLDYACYGLSANEYTFKKGTYYFVYESSQEYYCVNAYVWLRPKQKETIVRWLNEEPFVTNLKYESPGFTFDVFKEGIDYEIIGSTGKVSFRRYDLQKDGKWSTQWWTFPPSKLGTSKIQIVVEGDMNYLDGMSEFRTLVLEKIDNPVNMFSWIETAEFSQVYNGGWFQVFKDVHYTNPYSYTFNFEMQKLQDDGTWQIVTFIRDVGEYRIRATYTGRSDYVDFYSEWQSVTILPKSN